MKRHAAIICLVLISMTFADVITLRSNSWLNCVTRDTTTRYTSDQMCAQSPNIPYTFYWAYFDNSTCMCPCSPYISIGALRPFYISKHPMSNSQYYTISQLQDTTVFQKCSTLTFTSVDGQGEVGCKMSTTQCNCTGSNMKDTLCTRLFLFEQTNSIAYMPIKIQSIFARGVSENGCGGEVVDSITVSYGLLAGVAPRGTARPKPNSANVAQLKGLTTVSGRTLRQSSRLPGAYIEGNKKTIQLY